MFIGDIFAIPYSNHGRHPLWIQSSRNVSCFADMREKVIGTAAVAAAAGIIAAGYVYLRRRRLPTEWRQIGTLEHIYISPLKSGFFAEQSEAVCEVPGLTGTNRRLRDR